MYYVARTYQSMNPTIIMEFQTKEHAVQYVELMHKAGKGKYIVLTELV